MVSKIERHDSDMTCSISEKKKKKPAPNHNSAEGTSLFITLSVQKNISYSVIAKSTG